MQERKSVERVEAARLLEGLSSRDWRELGRQMASVDLLHARAVECIRRLQRESTSAGGDCREGVELHALSANWSKDFLVGALDGLIDERLIRTNEVHTHTHNSCNVLALSSSSSSATSWSMIRRRSSPRAR
jgi:hypothetical protein